MKKFLRIELVESVPIGIAIFVAQVVQFSLSDVNENWVFPGSDFAHSKLYMWAIVGFITGIFNVAWEDFTKSRDYFLHRGRERRTLYRWRTLTSLLLLLILLVGPLLLSSLWHLLMSENASLMRWSRLAQLLSIGTVTFSSMMLASWATSLPIAALSRWLVGLAAGATLVLTSQEILQPAENGLAALAGFLALQIAVSWIAWLAMERNIEQGRDEDRNTPFATQRLHAGIAVLCSVVAFGALASVVQKNFHRTLLGRYPSMFLGSNEDILLSVSGEPGAGNSIQVDERHRPVEDGPAQSSSKGTWLYWPWGRDSDLFRPAWQTKEGYDHRRMEQADYLFEGAWERVRETRLEQAWLYRADGSIHAWTLASPQSRPSHTRLVKPDGTGFSSEVELIGRLKDSEAPHSAALIGDPKDGTLWVVRQGDGRNSLERITLPGGDRYVTWHLWTQEKVWIEGQENMFDWDGETLGSVDPRSVAMRKESDNWRLEARMGDEDPLHFRVTLVERETGREIASHDYAPYTFAERLDATVVVTASLLRAPLIQLLSFVSPREEQSADRVRFHDGWKYAPLVAAGRRPWLLAIHLVIAIALATFTSRRMKRLGASRQRGLSWTFLVLLAGPAGCFANLALETERAWRWRMQSTPPTDALLIRDVDTSPEDAPRSTEKLLGGCT